MCVTAIPRNKVRRNSRVEIDYTWRSGNRSGPRDVLKTPHSAIRKRVPPSSKSLAAIRRKFESRLDLMNFE